MCVGVCLCAISSDRKEKSSGSTVLVNVTNLQVGPSSRTRTKADIDTQFHTLTAAKGSYSHSGKQALLLGIVPVPGDLNMQIYELGSDEKPKRGNR